MSKQRKKPAGGDPYRRGYKNGVMAAVEAMFDDLQEHDALEGEEYDEETGLSLRCYGCMLELNHFGRLADRWRFVVGQLHGDGHGPAS